MSRKTIILLVALTAVIFAVGAAFAVPVSKVLDQFATAKILTALNLDFGTASTAVALNSSKNLVSVAGVSDTELGYLSAVTSDVQAQINAKAPIDSPSFTTLVDLAYATGSLALATNASGNIVEVAGVSDTELGYLSAVTSDVQAQINAKAPATSPTFATDLTCSFATASTAAAFNASKQLVSVAGVSDTELGYLSAVTSDVQAQINAKAPIDSPSFTTLLDLGYAAGSLALATNASGNIVEVTGVSDTELGYLSAVTSDVQAQINAKSPSTSPTFATDLTCSFATASTAAVFDASKKLVSVTAVSDTEVGYLDGVTSAIQTQLNAKPSKTFTLASGANTSCVTTCGAGKTSMFGVDTAAGDVIVAPDDATADKCICVAD